MHTKRFLPLLACLCLAATGRAWDEPADTLATDSTHTLSEIVVTGTRNATDIRHLPMTISVVNRLQLADRYQPSILPALTEEVPGLFVTSRGVMGYGVSTGAAGGISMRGMSGSAQMLVLIDGHPQYMGLFGHPIADSYQTMLAERVEVLRGPASVLYGSNAMGGVINIVTRQMQEDGVQTDIDLGAGSYGTVQAEATNQVRKGRFGSTASASYSRTDGHRADMGFEQYSGYAKLSYDLTENWRLWGDVNVTHFNASNPGETGNPLIDNDSRITRGMASAMLENHYERTSGGLSLFYNWGRHKINDGYHPGKEPQESLFHSKDLMAGVSWYQSASLYEGNRLTVGLDYQHFGGQSWNEAIADGLRTPGVDKTQDEVAAYADFRQDIGQWLSLNAGVRVDHHSHVGTELIPQGGLAFHLPRQAELKVMASKGFRNPTIREMYMFPTVERCVAGTADELRTLLQPTDFGRLPHLRCKPLLHQWQEPHYDLAQCRRTATERQHRGHRELGRRGQRGMAHQYLLEHAGQLQLGTHGTSRHVRSRAQTLRGRQLQKRDDGAWPQASNTSTACILPSAR